MLNQSPCANCPERVLHCHSKCEKYLAYHEKVCAIRKAKADALNSESDFRKVRSKKWRDKHD